MTGYVLAILTGVFFGLQGFYSKIYTRKLPILLLTWGMFTFSLPFFLIMLAVEGIPPIAWRGFLYATGTSFLINTVNWYLFFKALEKAPLAHTMPFTSFTPLFLIPVAYFLLGEMPNLSGFWGILLIIGGAYGIHLQSGNLLAPFKHLFSEAGTRLMLLVALLWSVTATVEKVAVLSSSPAFYGFTIDALLAMVYTPYLFWRGKSKRQLAQQHLPQLFLLGFINGLLILFQFTALKFLLVSYVIAFKRAGALISVLLGALVLKEKHPVKNLVSTALMILGAYLIMR